MHEVSIANALLAQVRRHTPAGARAIVIRVEAGPRQSIDGQALAWAWEASTLETELAGSRLEFTALPYMLTCRTCEREWTSSDPFETCTCGAAAVSIGSAQLRLMSLEVESPEPDEPQGATSHACGSC